MNGLFNVTTIPRAVFTGFVVTFLALGVTSFYRLMVGNEGMVTPNSLIPCVVAGLIAGAMGYLCRDQRVMALKARGRLDPDSDGSELPIGGSPSTIPRFFGYIAMMTFVVQGILLRCRWPVCGGRGTQIGVIGSLPWRLSRSLV